MQGLVSRILPFSSVDGPGNRCVIFFQGCNYKCIYCHNPETIGICNNCGTCVEVCPKSALQIKGSKVFWDKNKCVGCDACIRKCLFNSDPRTLAMSVEEILNEVRTIKPFISGVTLSGGECSLQADFLLDLVKAVKKESLTCFIDTNGGVELSNYPDLVDNIDGVMLDVKAYNSDEHVKLTGVENYNVFKNLNYLAKRKKLYEVRTVIVPGLINCEETVNKVSRLISDLNPDIIYRLIKCRNHNQNPLFAECLPDDSLMEMLKQKALRNECRKVIIT